MGAPPKNPTFPKTVPFYLECHHSGIVKQNRRFRKGEGVQNFQNLASIPFKEYELLIQCQHSIAIVIEIMVKY